MASVFLSYDRDDADKARPVAVALEKAGHSVWWDQHIKAGAQYSKEIDRALKEADAVVVLWSERSVDSAWVRDEAAAGRDSGRLVPVSLDHTVPPLGFRQYQTIELTGTRGRGRSVALTQLVGAVEALSGLGATNPSEARPLRQLKSRKTSLIAAALAVLALTIAAAGLVLWRPWASAKVPLVAVVASDSTSDTRSLARDLLIKLGGLQEARADVFRLVQSDSTRDAGADLTLEAGAARTGTQLEANLALIGGRDRSLLWSRQFVQPDGKEGHLRQQIAVTAGRVLDCALQALNDKNADVRLDVLKLYLNGCASFDELAYGDLRRMIPVMREVTRRAPKFDGAWAKLIQAEVLTVVAGGGDPALAPQLRKDIAQARLADPHMAEAYLAEVELLPPTAYAERLRLTDLATRYNPNHPEPFAARSYYLRFVGRMADSVENAKRASELNPLSPALRNDYITALSHAGEFDRAKEELERSEKLWPGSSVVADARFRFNLRYGDARLALRDDQRGATLWAPRLTERFLAARIAPTPANVDRAVQEARAVVRQDPAAIVVLIQVLGAFDRTNELLATLLDGRQSLDPQIAEVLFRPTMSEVWRDPRFMLVAERIGLIDYWRQSGKWPDFCFEADLPYDCKAEAAKLK